MTELEQLIQLRYATLQLIDAVIEREGAFGMTFDGHEFEARGKCGNECAYERTPPFGKWSFEECMRLLDKVREYLAEPPVPYDILPADVLEEPHGEVPFIPQPTGPEDRQGQGQGPARPDQSPAAVRPRQPEAVQGQPAEIGPIPAGWRERRLAEPVQGTDKWWSHVGQQWVSVQAGLYNIVGGPSHCIVRGRAQCILGPNNKIICPE